MNILAFGAHPDDIEIQCAGTLYEYKQQGHQVFMACASNGDMGHMFIPPEELARIRESEMRKSASILGAEVLWLDISGPQIREDDETRLLFLDAVRQVKPDVLITHHPDDYHDNHRAVSRLLREVIFQATLPHIKSNYPATETVPALVYMDNFAGLNFQPTDYVDITKAIEVKKEMLSAHESQIEWLMAHSKLDVIDHMLTIGKYRGYQVGVSYAEGFMVVPSFPLIKAHSIFPTPR